MRVFAILFCTLLSAPALAQTKLIVAAGGYDTSNGGVSGNDIGYSLRYIDRSGVVFYALADFGESKNAGVTSKNRQSTIGVGYTLGNTLDEFGGSGYRWILGASGGALRATYSGAAHVTTYRTLFSTLETSFAPRHLLTATGEATWDSRNSDPTIAVTAAYEMPVGERLTFEPKVFGVNNKRSDSLGLSLGAGFDLGRGMEIKVAANRARINSSGTTGTQTGWSAGLELNF